MFYVACTMLAYTVFHVSVLTRSVVSAFFPPSNCIQLHPNSSFPFRSESHPFQSVMFLSSLGSSSWPLAFEFATLATHTIAI